MANLWFKFYGGEYLADPKMAALSPQERSCWLTLLCLASMATVQGEIGFLTVEVLLDKSGIIFDPYNPEEWNNNLGVLKKFEKMKMLSLNEDGSVSVLNWEKRQEHNLTVAERVAKSRLNKKNVTTNVTNVTSEKNRIEKNRNTISNETLQIVEEDSSSRKKTVRVDEHLLEVFRVFSVRYPKNWEANTTQRNAAQRLVDEHGIEQIKKAVEFYNANKDTEYCPNVNTPMKLDSKWTDLFDFKKKNGL